MKRKIKPGFKSYQKILLLILILLATLLFGFINGSVEGFLAVNTPTNKEASVDQHKAAANRRGSGDAKMAQEQEGNYTKNDDLNT